LDLATASKDIGYRPMHSWASVTLEKDRLVSWVDLEFDVEQFYPWKAGPTAQKRLQQLSHSLNYLGWQRPNLACLRSTRGTILALVCVNLYTCFISFDDMVMDRDNHQEFSVLTFSCMCLSSFLIALAFSYTDIEHSESHPERNLYTSLWVWLNTALCACLIADVLLHLSILSGAKDANTSSVSHVTFGMLALFVFTLRNLEVVLLDENKDEKVWLALSTFVSEWVDMSLNVALLLEYSQKPNSSPAVVTIYAVFSGLNLIVYILPTVFWARKGTLKGEKAVTLLVQHIAITDFLSDTPILIVTIAERAYHGSTFITFVLVINIVWFLKSCIFNPIRYWIIQANEVNDENQSRPTSSKTMKDEGNRSVIDAEGELNLDQLLGSILHCCSGCIPKRTERRNSVAPSLVSVAPRQGITKKATSGLQQA